MRQHLGWIPGEMDAQKKVYWSVLLLDTLQGMTCGRESPLLCRIFAGVVWCMNISPAFILEIVFRDVVPSLLGSAYIFSVLPLHRVPREAVELAHPRNEG
jgi:hypothetical protein